MMLEIKSGVGSSFFGECVSSAFCAWYTLLKWRPLDAGIADRKALCSDLTGATTSFDRGEQC